MENHFISIFIFNILQCWLNKVILNVSFMTVYYVHELYEMNC